MWCLAGALVGSTGAQAAWLVRAGSPLSVVDDTERGLVWDRCVFGQRGADCEQGAPQRLTHAEARRAVVQANQSAYKGHRNWRLPTFTELNTLVRTPQAEGSPALDTKVFPASPAQAVWTPTLAAAPTRSAMTVDFANGATQARARDQLALVRLVRDAEPAAASAGLYGGWDMVLDTLATPSGQDLFSPIFVLALPALRRRRPRSDTGVPRL